MRPNFCQYPLPTRPRQQQHVARVALVASISLMLVFAAALGCTQVKQSDLTDLRTGVAGVRQQASLAFTSANDLARKQAIERVMASTRPALSEKDFVGAVSPEDIRKWDEQFALLDSYVTALNALLSPERTKALEDSAVDLANQLAASDTTHTAVPVTVATGFTQAGKALITAKAQHDAMKIMQATDPGIRTALMGMADAIHEDKHNSGLRTTVMTNWAAALTSTSAGSPTSQWQKALQDKNDAEKRAAIDHFLQMIEARDAQLAALDGLRQSLLQLADAHTHAAQGSKSSADAIIAYITKQAEETQAVYKRFNAIQDEHNAPTTNPSNTTP
jgi:hypothetical protein